MKFLVTGSNGFVGRYIVRYLKDKGHYVVGAGRRETSASPVDDYKRIDLTLPLTEKSFEDKFDAVIHCAALASPWAATKDFYKHNVDATQHLLDYCSSVGNPHFVYVSSTSVYYKNEDQFNIDEHTKKPDLENQINVYSRTKLIGEHLTEKYRGTYAIMRPRAVYGPEDQVLLPRLIKIAQTKGLPEMTRADGKRAVGDLVYVGNLAACIAEAAIRKIEGDYNLTNDEPVEIVAFVESVLKRLGLSFSGKKIPVSLAFFAARMLEVSSSLFFKHKEPPITRFGVSVFAYSKTFDVSKMKKTFGKPEVSNEQGIDQLLKWWKNQETVAT